MDWFVKAFLKSSLVWFAAGVSLGVGMAVHPAWTVYRTAHLHMNLLGFVTMMIYGVAYHVLPRFTGHPLHSRRLAAVQWWLANAGLLVFVLGFLMLPRTMYDASARVVVGVGAVVSGAAAFAFVYNIWRTIDGRATAPHGGPAAPTVPLRRQPRPG